MLRQGDWVTSLDLTDAYFHIPIRPSSRKFLRFAILGLVFQFRALPFGLSSAPWAFSRVVSELRLDFRRRGLQLFQYLDDCSWHHLLISLGFGPKNFYTCVITWVSYEGLCISGLSVLPIDQWVVLPTKERIIRIRQLARILLESEGQDWQVFLVVLASTEKMVSLRRSYMREIQFALKEGWNAQTDYPSDWVPLIGRGKIFFGGYTCSRMLPTWDGGAHLNFQLVSGTWSCQWERQHINLQEMEAVRLAVLH